MILLRSTVSASRIGLIMSDTPSSTGAVRWQSKRRIMDELGLSDMGWKRERISAKIQSTTELVAEVEVNINGEMQPVSIENE